jgi:protein-S-isoprenylcysteine O-methyltransferase Ste14
MPDDPAPAEPDLRPLPPVRAAGLAHVVIPGTAVWFVAFVVLLFLLPILHSHDALAWLWTALAGWLLGFVGLAIYGWQRSAARRGSRGASQMALDETLSSRET